MTDRETVESICAKALTYCYNIPWFTRARSDLVKDFSELNRFLWNNQNLKPKNYHSILSWIKKIRTTSSTRNSRMRKSDRVYLQKLIKEIEKICIKNLQTELFSVVR